MKKESYNILRVCENLILLLLAYKKNINLSKKILDYHININITCSNHISIYLNISNFGSITTTSSNIISFNADNIQPVELNLPIEDIKGEMIYFDDRYCEYDVNSPNLVGAYLKKYDPDIDGYNETNCHEVMENSYDEWAFQYSTLYDFVPDKEDYFYLKNFMHKLGNEFDYTYSSILFESKVDIANLKSAIDICTETVKRKIDENSDI